MSGTSIKAPAISHMKAFLSTVMEPGQVTELRALHVPGGFKVGGTWSGYFNDVGAMAEAAYDLTDRLEAPGTYWTVNPVLPDLFSRSPNKHRQVKGHPTTDDTEIARRSILPVDCDPLRVSDISSSDLEHEAALERGRTIQAALKAEGWPDPVRLDTGNGCQLLYRVDLPNTPEAKALVSGVLAGLQARFGDPTPKGPDGKTLWAECPGLVEIDQTVENAGRLSRLPGTKNRKGGHTSERPHRWCQTLELPHAFVPVAVELLEAVALKPEPPASAPPKRKASRIPAGGRTLQDWRDLFEPNARGPKPLDGGGQLYELEFCPWEPSHGQWQAFIGQKSSGELVAGCHHKSCAGNEWPQYRALRDPKPDKKTKPERPADDDEKPTETLIRLAAAVELSQHEGEAYATLTIGTRRETHRLPSAPVRRWLTMQYYRDRGWPPQKDALASVLGLLEARALDEGPERPVYLRVARHEAKLYLDLADRKGQVVEVSASGWRVITDPPVLYLRPPKMRPLPVPVPGTLQPLRDLLRLPEGEAGDQGWRLSVAWVLHAYTVGTAYPILTLTGPEGAAKTSAARILRGLVDPHASATRRPPKEEECLAVAAAGTHVLALDNLSSIPEWLSDGLCCVATGGSLGRRQRYTDQEETVTSYMRPIILTGITVTGKPDLADRMVRVSLGVVPDGERRTEADIAAAYEAARPGILGALLDAVAMGLRRLSQVSLANLPRLADFALWATACEAALPWEEGGVMAALHRGRETMAASTVEGDIVGSVLLLLLDRRPVDGTGARTWAGTASQLLGDLESLSTAAALRSKYWPVTPHFLSRRLRALEGALRRQGVTIERDRAGKDRSRLLTITLRPLPKPADANDLADAGGRRQSLSQRPPENGLSIGSQDRRTLADADSPLLSEKGIGIGGSAECPSARSAMGADLASAASSASAAFANQHGYEVPNADTKADANELADANEALGGWL